MSRLNISNLKKAAYYLKRNGVKKTWYAVWERLEERKLPPYQWEENGERELASQREKSTGFSTTFSILVPTYCTREDYLREMIASLTSQTYSKWELILADATPDTSVEKIVKTITDARIRYVRLAKNAGIAENTNQALKLATGDYVGLLDHDDVLTADALYEMAARIEEAKKSGRQLQMLYSDEDKCNGDRSCYYEPHFKEDFNLDLLLSNNYICHFLVMKRELIQDLGFRSEFDGAQDFDLVLRAAARLMEQEELIVHIPKVLYHWRCHTGSTAENPQSKLYAYEAGRRAIQDFADKAGWNATAEDTAHVGFYCLRYHGDIFQIRPDVGAIGGPLISKGKIVGGRMDEAGNTIYKNLSHHYSGYMHRAVLHQDAMAVDIRNMRVRPEIQADFDKITRDIENTDKKTELQQNQEIRESIELCEKLRNKGYRILYLPKMRKKV